MRTYIISFALIAISAAACQNSGDKSAATNAGQSPVDPHIQSAQNVDSSTFTKIEWLDNDRDFGKVNEGQKVEVTFRFKNTGDNPLIIYSVSPGCGCTAAEPPKEPILPGKEGVIKGSFDSNGRSGTNNKSIYVKANTLGGMDHTLRFKVEVQGTKQ